MKYYLFLIGMWCLKKSGRGGDMLEALTRYHDQLIITDGIRTKYLKTSEKFRSFVDSARLVDGLMSADHPKEAQAQLRVALGVATNWI